MQLESLKEFAQWLAEAGTPKKHLMSPAITTNAPESGSPSRYAESKKASL